MTRSSLAWLIAPVVALGAACGEESQAFDIPITLDRPVDVAFACYGNLRILQGATPAPEDPVESTAMPTTACDIRSTRIAVPATNPVTPPAPLPVPPGQEDLPGSTLGTSRWYGMILQAGPGTVAFATFATAPLVEAVQLGDADPLTPGNNSISVGEDPVAITTDVAGCHALVANAGSCDLSVLDIPGAIELQSKVDRLAVTNGVVPIRARPAAMVAQQPTPAGVPGTETKIGASCPAQPVGLVYIAYPGCHMVAGVDASTGAIVTGIQYDGNGVPSIITDPSAISCPDECAGAAATMGTRPVTLDLEYDPKITGTNNDGSGARRLMIGADNSPSLTLVELDLESRPASVRQIALEDTTASLGVTRVAMSPRIGMGGDVGVVEDNDNALGGLFQFGYAIATDGTVRVADLNAGSECDTQVDPRFVRDVQDVGQTACFRVDDPTPRPRRAGVRGPGIDFGGSAAPIAIEIFRADETRNLANRDELLLQELTGHFAVVSLSSGVNVVINIDDDDRADVFDPSNPLVAPIPSVMPHQLRDIVQDRGAVPEVEIPPVPPEMARTKVPACDGVPNPTVGAVSAGGPRTVGNPARLFSEAIISGQKLDQLPNIRGVRCVGRDFSAATTITSPIREFAVPETAFIAPTAVRDVVFPDLRTMASDETWTLTWEGPLSFDNATSAVDGPQVRESEMLVDQIGGMRLRDNSRPFCDVGVEPFDIVQLRGCDPGVGNSDCPLGYRCFVHPESQISGLGACMLDSEADRLANACKDFLTSLRRYTVASSAAGEIQLVARRRELLTSPVDGCVDDNQCQALASYAATLPQDDFVATPPVDSHVYSCTADAARPPVATGKRCFMRCNTTADCVGGGVGAAPGTICQGGGAGPNSGFCMEGVLPPQSCVNAPQRYELRAGNAFSVIGTTTGYIHPIIAEPDADIDRNTRCIRDPSASPLLIGRVPLSAPACDPDADPLTGRNPTTGVFEPNPCSTTIDNVQAKEREYADPATCTRFPPDAVVRAVDRPGTPAIRFRNRQLNLTIVDPFYAGDARCLLDRLGGLGKIPHVFTGFQIQLRINAGFSPRVLGVPSVYPVKLVRGPAQSIWVVDEGDFLSSDPRNTPTRGRVVRVQPNTPSGTATVQ